MFWFVSGPDCASFAFMPTAASIEAMIRECSMYDEHLGGRTAARAPDDVVVNPDVILGHAVGREALLKAVAHAPTIEHGGAIDRAQCIIWIDHVPSHPLVNNFRTEPHRNAMTGVPHAIASIITRPNRSGQQIGNSSAAALPRNSVLCASSISPTNSTSVPWSNGFMRCVK